MIYVDSTVPRMACSSDVAPTVRASGDTLHLAYRVSHDVSSRDVCAVIRFLGVRDWHQGYPNDEALDSHPLHGHGLEQYQFHVSSVATHGERAWVATFHDGTLTVYADRMEVLATVQANDPPNALRAVLGAGPTQGLDDDA